MPRFQSDMVPTMTEAEWQSCRDSRHMLRFLLGTDSPRIQDVESFPNCKASDRKLRLFACACYWHIAHLLPDPLARTAIEVAELVADGRVPSDELRWAESILRGPIDALEGPWRASRGAERIAIAPRHNALALAGITVWDQAQKAAYYAASNASHARASIMHPGEMPSATGFGACQADEQRAQTEMLRCIFGDLFHEDAIPTHVLTWNDGAVRKLAQRIYEERAFDQLPLLAEAVVEAESEDDALLIHLCMTGPHSRGCWAVDALRQRSR